ncbi:MAG: TIGR03089 family protein [Rhodococcus sp.]|nr:TIGR03089 family protein [Rhodococcus sp. (in: high G+C Gram-positive bacteria)]
MLSSNLTDALLSPILSVDAAGPRITYYDDATGERIELSALTLANWAAKTANMLRDEFGLTPGDKVAVSLPAHWQTAAVLLGVWWAGGEVLLDLSDVDDAAVALVTVDHLESVDSVDEIAVLSLDPFGRPVPDLPIGVTDYATTVRVHGDQFQTAGAGPVFDGLDADAVLEQAQAAARELGLSAADRVLATAPWDTTEHLVQNFLAILAAGASLVHVANPDADAQTRRVTSEKITRQLP